MIWSNLRLKNERSFNFYPLWSRDRRFHFEASYHRERVYHGWKRVYHSFYFSFCFFFKSSVFRCIPNLMSKQGLQNLNSSNLPSMHTCSAKFKTKAKMMAVGVANGYLSGRRGLSGSNYIWTFTHPTRNKKLIRYARKSRQDNDVTEKGTELVDPKHPSREPIPIDFACRYWDTAVRSQWMLYYRNVLEDRFTKWCSKPKEAKRNLKNLGCGESLSGERSWHHGNTKRHRSGLFEPCKPLKKQFF